MPCAAAWRPAARSDALAVAAGESDTVARTAAIAASVARWHAEGPQCPLLLASYDELRYRRTTLDVAWLTRVGPASFPVHRRLLWAEGLDLLQDEPVWVPFETVHADEAILDLPACGLFPADHVGLAAGPDLPAAALRLA